MSRSVKDSDDDVEPKAATGRMQTRMLTVQSMVNSPLRRSSRIKQTKYSPGSESDSSISSTQTTQSSRTRTATMDSIVSDKKKLRTRKHSVSSEISETIGVDVPQTPGKRTTRQSTGATIGTPTRVNTRAASKRLMRAGSETKSPLPAARTTRRTRASSIEPESLSDRNKSQSGSPIKTRRRTSVLSLDSVVKEQTELEDRIPYVRLDATIIETDEIISSGNSDSSPDKALRFSQSQKINRKRQNTNKDEVEEDHSHRKVETSTDSLKSDETLQLLEKMAETQAEDIDKVIMDVVNETLNEGQHRFEITPPSNSDTIDQVSTHDSSSDHRSSSVKEDKVEIVEEDLSNIEKSLIDICESTKVLGKLCENVLDTSTEEEKNNKENQMLNIISDVSTEKPNVISYTKSLASPSMNKSSSEKETKSKKERSLSKERCSRESIENAIKHSDFSKEIIDSSQEKMDISIESSNSTAINKTVLSQHDSTELVDKVIDKDETSVENINTSTYNEDATEVISKSDKIDKIEYTITDSKSPNKTESDEVDKTSRSSTSLVKITQISGSRESLTSILTIDDNEIKLVLERSPLRDEVPSNVADLQISSPVNKSSDDRSTGTDKQLAVIQDEVTDRSDSTEQEQKNLSKHITESAPKSSNDVLETNNSACDDSNNTVIQNNQFPDIVAAKNCVMDISFEKTDAKDISSKKIVKRNLKRKNSDGLDNLEVEKESSQMDTSQKDQENMEIADDISDIGIDLFQNIPANKWQEKNDVKIDSVQSTFQSVEKVEDENEAECDLILVDKRAWLAAETIKAAKEAEPFEYDSDDTVLLKSRLDVAQAIYNAKKFDTVSEELLMDIDDEENEKQVKKRKSNTKRRLTSEIDKDSSRSTQDEDNLVTADKSLNESKTALNRTNDRFISKLNKSEQSARTSGQPFKANDESDEEIEDDANEFNRSPLKNTSLRKSIGRTSLNKSSKDISMQNISANKLQTDNSEEELDNAPAHTEKKLYKKKHSLNKSCNVDADDVIESEKKNVSTKDNSKKNKNTSLNRSVDQKSKPIDIIKMMIHSNDDESDDSDINITAMDLGSKTYSMIANAGSDIDSSDGDECTVPDFLFAIASSNDDTDDSSINSDINKEYNLDGIEQKFSDDDVAADECRTSEVEFSDSDDNGSDLADFIVDDYEVEDENEENEKEEENDDDDDEDIQNMKEDDKSENEQNVKEDDKAAEKEEVKDEEDKQIHIKRYTEPINIESENEDDDEDVQKKDDVADIDEDTDDGILDEMRAIISSYASTSKLPKDVQEKIDVADTEEDTDEDTYDSILTEMKAIISSYSSTSKLPKVHKSKDKSIEYISPHRSETEMKRDIKMKKSNVEENKKIILLDSSNSDLSSKKKKKKSLMKENEIFSRDVAERNSSEQLSESKLTSTKRLSKSRVMEFSTPNLNTCKKFELDETFERTSESKDIKSDNMIKAMQNTSETKEKSKKDPTLNKDINLRKFSYASKEKMSRDLSPDLLELLKKTSFLLSTSSKGELYKTMNNIDTDTPTIKHLRKEKLNESAPALSNTETSSLRKKLSTENVQHTAQIKINNKDKNNEDEVSDLIILSNDDTIQKHNSKKQKKRKRTSKENITDEALSEDAIELKVPKKKKRSKFTQLAIVEDNIREDACQITEKKKKQETSKKNITDKDLSEDAMELKIPKKKKRAKLTQLAIAEDNAREDTCHIIEKKKKQETSKENITDKDLSENAMELKIPKKKKRAKLTQLAIAEDNAREDTCQIIEKKKKKKIQETSKENITDKDLSEDPMELKVPKKKKRAKLTQLAIVEGNAREDMCQIKKKKKKQETLKENIAKKALSEDPIDLKISEKKKRATLRQLVIVKDNIHKNAYQVNEKEKKKKKQVKENITEKALSEDVVELKISKKRKRAKLSQLDIIEDNTREDMYQINEKEKKKKKKQTNELAEQDTHVKNTCGSKMELAQHKKKNKILNSLELNSLADKQKKQVKKKTKQEETVENIKTLRTEKKKKKKKNILPVQIPVPKLRSEKVSLPNKLRLQKTALDTSELENMAYTTKELDEAIRAAMMYIPEELKPKKKRNRVEDIENVIHMNVPTKKSKKELKEVNKFLPSSSGLKRLSDDVIENLTDVPTRAKKRRKISRNEEQIVSSMTTNKSKATTADRDDMFTLSTSGCTTQFHIVNLQNTKNQSAKEAAAATSFRQRMLARNNREPISAYMMYREKMRNAK